MKPRLTLELRRTLCDQAIDHAFGWNASLDYTDDSIRDVERVLAEIHKLYKETGEDSGLQGIAIQFAAYLVAVIEKNHGPVDWQRDHPQMGEDSFPLNWNGTTLFPFGWCLKRIFDGSDDDIVSKWQVYVLGRSGGTAAK